MNRIHHYFFIFAMTFMIIQAVACSSNTAGDSGELTGSTFNWLGSSSAAPLNPEINDVYFNSIDGNSYIFNGASWDILAEHGADGADGINGISVNWLGTLVSAPVSPSFNDAYYNSTDGKSYLWNGLTWQVISQDGTDGINGTDGVSIVWLGSLAIAPVTPVLNNAYYNTTDNKSYVWNGTGWSVICQDGSDGTGGTGGVPIVWLGSLASVPETPELNNAYYNTTEGRSYIWDGTDWRVLAQDGAPEISWIEVTSTAIQGESNTGYVANNSSQVTVTLPASPAIGDIIKVTGAGTGGWKIAQNAAQYIITKSIPATTISSPIGHVWTQRGTSLNWRCVASSSDGRKLAAIAGGNIYTSTDSGISWTQRYSGPTWYSVASSSNGTKLVAVAPGYIYTSTDSGISWTQRYTGPAFYSVTSSSDGTKLAAVVNGGYIFTSTDSGLNWTQRGVGLNWLSVASSSDGTRLVAVGPGPIFTSTDSGVNWTQRYSGPSWSSVTSSSDGTKLVAVASGAIYTSTDSGISWIQRFGGPNYYSVSSSSDGVNLAAVGPGSVFTSTDSGNSWIQRFSGSNFYSVTSSSDGTKLVAVAYGGYIYTSIPSTTAGTSGSIVGYQYDSIELQYVGNNTFTVIGYEGNIDVY